MQIDKEINLIFFLKFSHLSKVTFFLHAMGIIEKVILEFEIAS